LFFLFLATGRVCRFHWLTYSGKRTGAGMPQSAQVNMLASTAFLLIWLASTLVLFSQLTILVGTHYYLPVAPPLFLAGAYGLITIARFLARIAWKNKDVGQQVQESRSMLPQPGKGMFDWQRGLLFALLTIMLVGPHLLGLITINDADGYSSEFFNGENTNVQVLYTGYHDADEWLIAHSKTGGRIGIVGGPSTGLWYISNPRQKGKFHFIVTQYGSKEFPFDYLVWPMNLIQRHWNPPAQWWSHIVHTVTGGNTIYCYIMARDPSTLTP
ncbi:MAG: hypothetical protein ACJ788_17390, partial [Ktedonobacteraceae bacterium]